MDDKGSKAQDSSCDGEYVLRRLPIGKASILNASDGSTEHKDDGDAVDSAINCGDFA
jgi:hypothetical protein